MGEELPEIMSIKNLTIAQGVISLDLFRLKKVAEVQMSQETYKVIHLKIIEEDDEDEELF